MSFTELSSAPRGIISRVKFSPLDQNYLLVSSWDGTLRVYSSGEDSRQNQVVFEESTNAPILDTCWDPERHASVFYGGVESRTYELNLETNEQFIVGEDHGNALSGLIYHQDTRSLLTGSWDKTLRQVDPRAPGRNPFEVALPEKMITMDASKNTLVVGMSQRLINIFDIRNLSRPLDTRTSSLRRATRTVKAMPDGTGYVTTSIDGRVAVEYYDPQAQSKAFAFKGHRITNKTTGAKVSTPINAVAFHPKYDTFFTGAGDANVALWDLKARTRRRAYPGFSQAVMSIDVSLTGDQLAVATSSDELGLRNSSAFWSEFTNSGLFIRRLDASECKGRLG